MIGQFEVPPYDGGFELGTYENGKYYNRYLGAGIKLDRDWEIYCGEDLMEYNVVFAELQLLTEEEYTDLLEKGEVAGFNDFLASKTSATNVISTIGVSALKTSVDEETLSKYIKNNDDLIEFVKAYMLSDVEEGFKESGLTNISEAEFTELDLNGKYAVVIKQTGMISGYKCNMSYVVKVAGAHLVMINVLSTAGESAVADILENVYILD